MKWKKVKLLSLLQKEELVSSVARNENAEFTAKYGYYKYNYRQRNKAI